MPKLIDWFIPDDGSSQRASHNLASIFIYTHIFGPLLALPMWLFLWAATDAPRNILLTLTGLTVSFVFLPLLLKFTGRFQLVTIMSFQLLAGTSLFASLHFGGFNSPFIHWLIVSLLLGLFYQSKSYHIVLGFFSLDILVFLMLARQRVQEADIPVDQLNILGWLSVGSATIYVAWMAYYYSRIVGMKSELEAEVERGRQTSRELESARAIAEDFAQRRSRFFAKMNHDLRTPLNAIIGYSEVLLEDIEYDSGADDPRHADVRRIKAAGNHLLSLVSRVLDSDTIQEEENRVEVREVTLGHIRDDVIAAIGPEIERQGNQFAVYCPDPRYILSTDATKLRQIVINLLSNAAKFTNKGVVKLDLVIMRKDGRDILKASVSDTGIGISSEAMTRLFRDYEQANVDTVTKYGGTGIGLALSQHLAALLGGEIDVTSIAERGSRFTALLPAHFEPEDPAEQPDTPAKAAQTVFGFPASAAQLINGKRATS